VGKIFIFSILLWSAPVLACPDGQEKAQDLVLIPMFIGDQMYIIPNYLDSCREADPQPHTPKER